jgi:hypothetical protein
MDCDFGLNQSDDDNHTLTDNSQEPDAQETRQIN